MDEYNELDLTYFNILFTSNVKYTAIYTQVKEVQRTQKYRVLAWNSKVGAVR